MKMNLGACFSVKLIPLILGLFLSISSLVQAQYYYWPGPAKDSKNSSEVIWGAVPKNSECSQCYTKEQRLSCSRCYDICKDEYRDGHSEHKQLIIALDKLRLAGECN